MSKLQRIKEMENQLAALRAEIETESKVEKWMPKGTFVMLGNGGIANDKTPGNYVNMGNVRATEPLAKRAIKRRLPRDLIAAYVDEYEPDYEPDWSDGSEPKCSVAYRSPEWHIVSNYHVRSPSDVYMPQKLAKQLLEDIKSGRVDLGYPVKEGDL